ncbi:uncharacterized protein LOC131155300 isoform X1 [Malania oleifera]|uniref:uncharacterized protein LOC131155300 isoform X1 n=1 Tax=Malania oleifera TaxID=397392 RepID=UPI0025AECC37|nr:uncharacterized protein LOC131155300 isoform X1 [Malania oleifera]
MAMSYSCSWNVLAPEKAVWKSLLSPSPLTVGNTRVLRVATFAVESKRSATVGAKEGRVKGIMKPRRISPALQELCGVPEIARTQALKLIWAHIKEHNLQDPENKKIIVCDEKLKKIFGGRDRVGFLEIAGLITPHFLQ